MIKRALQHLRIDRTDGGIVTVWVDVAGRSMNVFDASVIDEFDFVVSGLEQELRTATTVVEGTSITKRTDADHGNAAKENTSPLKVVVFRSAKPSGFFAGADVKQIAGLKGRSEVEEVIRRGQELFARIERLPIPTVAAIHGACLGGGLELALSCRHRIAQDSGATRLGLPEIQLGIIPGWGGTQRLPKLIGVSAALPMILTGKKLTASAALKAGLVDGVADSENWDSYVMKFASQVAGAAVSGGEKTAARGGAKGRTLVQKFTDETSIGRSIAFRLAEKNVARDARHYPALTAAIRAIRAAFDSGDGYATERDEFTRLVETTTCRNLLNLFFWREDARNMDVSSVKPVSSGSTDVGKNRLNELNSRLPDSTRDGAPAIHRIAVIGAGAMGAGIGQLAALKGYEVVLKELTSELAELGRNRVENLLDEMVAKKRLSTVERDAAMDRVTVTETFDDLKDCDLVIEAVVEKMDVKQAVFASLDAVLKPTAMIVSNTSALSVTKMADATSRPDRVAGLHFFNPVHRMDLVEVVRAGQTSDATTAALLKLVKKLGKTPVITSDSPGFLVNRVLFPYIGEAVRMVMEGHDVEQIDREIRGFGMPMGPIELIDHVGIDVAWHVATSLESVLPDSAEVIRLLGQMVARGWMGRKSGQGFYVYRKDHRAGVSDLASLVSASRLKRSRPSSEDLGPMPGVGGGPAGTFLDDGLTDVQRRLIYPMINEVGFCLHEGVVAEAWMADLAMILGTGFAPFRGGPMAMAEKIGLETVLNNLHVLIARHGDRFKPSAWLVEKRTSQGRPAADLVTG
ncbi:MAG: enoyl-CoA hydratase/isomerase family protein [Planctomycetaceae bacterium]|nr:enoyl-CoA hydratase/isomerase family protein [Planctomycetaceae bacterium]